MAAKLQTSNTHAATHAATQAATVAAEAAVALAKSASETAMALATAKVSSDTALALVGSDINYIKKELIEIKDTLKTQSNEYVTKDTFLPIQKIVYGLVSLLLIAVVGAIVGLVLVK